MCFVWVWEQTAIISLYSINWLVCITETECVYCAVGTGSLYIILRSAHTVYLCVLCGSENKQRLFPYTALTDWFLNRSRECLLRGTNWVFNSDRYSFVLKGLNSIHELFTTSCRIEAVHRDSLFSDYCNLYVAVMNVWPLFPTAFDEFWWDACV